MVTSVRATGGQPVGSSPQWEMNSTQVSTVTGGDSSSGSKGAGGAEEETGEEVREEISADG